MYIMNKTVGTIYKYTINPIEWTIDYSDLSKEYTSTIKNIKENKTYRVFKGKSLTETLTRTEYNSNNILDRTVSNELNKMHFYIKGILNGYTILKNLDK